MAGQDKHLEYNIDEAHDEENYQNNYLPFIERLRASLTDTQSHTIGVLVPQLPASEIHNESLLYLTLTSGDRSIIAVLQQSNLYVRGYSRDGGNTYWAFSDSTTMIPDSQSLGFDGNYIHIERVIGGDETDSNATRERLTPGYAQLHDAITSLANTEEPHQQQAIPAKGLLILAVMIAEAARIRLISNHISTYWWIPQAIPRNVIISLVNAWQTFSGAVQNSDTDVPPPYSSPLLPSTPLPNDTHIYTIRQAMAAFGLLIYYGKGGPRQKREVSQSSYARTLVCIEYIKINDIDGENPGDLYGTVTATDCWGQHVVYDRSRADSESKRPGEYATLTGPTSEISGADAFTISVSLMDRDRDASPDDQVAQKEITWDPRFQDSYYDKTVEHIIRGQYGNVSVGFSVITNALSATIKVVMINGDGENPADVYGTIKAIIPLGGSSSTSVSLFDKSSSEYQPVRPGSSIPLTRSVIPAPVNSNLIIKASLWDYDTLSFDDLIAEGSVPIMSIVTTGPAKPMTISGRYGEVQVSVVFE